MKRKLLTALLLIIAVALLLGTVMIGTTAAETEADLTSEGEPYVEIYKKNVEYSELLHVLYALDLNLPDGYDKDDVKMLFWTEEQDSYDKDSDSIEQISYCYGEMEIDGELRPVFRSYGIAARNIVDNIYARAYVSVDGVDYYSAVMKYSVLEYVHERLFDLDNAEETTDATVLVKRSNQRILYNRTLEYCAAAQTVFGYKTEELATAPRVYIEVVNGTLQTGSSTGVFLVGEEVTATTTAEDEWFKCWRDSARKDLSEEKTYTFTADKSAVIKAVEYSKGLAYTLSNDGTYYSVAGIGTCTDAELIIPPTYEGVSVTEIGSNAFYSCRNLTSATIPNSVTNIAGHSFQYCTSLTSVTIPDSVTNIGYNAFYDCTSLTSVNITDIASWCNIIFANYSTNPLYYAKNLHLNGELVTNIVVPKSVIAIPDHAFTNCTSLTNITISDSVTSIGGSAFNNCTSLTSLTIGNGVTSIGSSAFNNCTSLEVIKFNATTTTINTTDGIFRDAGKNGKGIKVIIGANVTQIPMQLFYNSSYPPKITDVEFEEGSMCTSIGDYAFAWCNSLVSITIPDSVTSIGDYAFYFCTSLPSVIIPDSVTSIGESAFNSCRSLPSVTIPNSVTSIGDSAFYACFKLTSVTIGNSVTNIGAYTFYQCDSLTNVYITDIAKWCDIKFDSAHANPLIFAKNLYLDEELVTNITIPEGVTAIPTYAFSCNSLTNVTIPVSVISIGDYAFYGCRKLTCVNIPDNVTNIGKYAFDNCSLITKVIIPDSVTSIDDFAFSGCSNLTSVTIGDSVTNIGHYAFSHCSSLTNVTIPYGVASISNHTFSSCVNLESITIPNSVTSIGESAFYGCERLVGTVIPHGVKSIGKSAFENCKNLESITIPETVTIIGDYAFGSCAKLNSTIFLGGVTGIGNYTFRFCTALENVTIPETVTSIGYYAFLGCSSLTNVTFENPDGWWYASSSSATSGTSVDVSDDETAATYLTSTYSGYYWKRSDTLQ